MSSMFEVQIAAGAQMIELHGCPVPQHFGDLAAEYRTLRSSAGLLDLSLRSKFRLTGADRARFLQNMLTNDVLSVAPGHGCHAAKLNVQGKLEAALHVLVHDEEIHCDLEPGAAELVLTGLRKRIILEDTEIEDVSGTWTLLALQGPEAEAVLKAVGVRGDLLQEELQHMTATIAQIPVRVVRSDHCGEGGYDLWVEVSQGPRLWDALLTAGAAAHVPIRPVGFAALDIRRIEAGLPWQGSELTLNEFPHEAGLDEGWISYTKGCYLGQETISRLHHMGHVNRHLRGLLLEGEVPPPPGSLLRSVDKSIGSVTSSTFSYELGRPVALGYVHRDFASPGTQIFAEHEDHRRAAEVTALPMF